MRLEAVARGRRAGRLKILALSTLLQERAPDVLRVLVYRPELFGRAYARYTQTLMRGKSEWTAGERELFATFVSKLNNCAFCTELHCSMAKRVLGEQFVAAALNDWKHAPLTPRLRAALGLLEKLTTRPGQLAADDIRAAQQAGISLGALNTVVHVAINFSIINRIADALGFEIPTSKAVARFGGVLLRMGYKV